MCYASVNPSGNNENKHGEVIFQIAAVYLNSSALIVRNLCDRHHIFKDNSWLYTLHQYHQASRSNACTARGIRGAFPIWQIRQHSFLSVKYLRLVALQQHKSECYL